MSFRFMGNQSARKAISRVRTSPVSRVGILISINIISVRTTLLQTPFMAMKTSLV